MAEGRRSKADGLRSKAEGRSFRFQVQGSKPLAIVIIELFQRNKSTISRHIKNVFDEGELNREVVVAFFATTKMKVERMLLLFCLIGTVRQLQNIFVEGELDKESVCRKFRRTATDGKNYSIQYYSLDAIIAVGYRVKNASFTDTRPPPAGTPSNLEGEF